MGYQRRYWVEKSESSCTSQAGVSPPDVVCSANGESICCCCWLGSAMAASAAKGEGMLGGGTLTRMGGRTAGPSTCTLALLRVLLAAGSGCLGGPISGSKRCMSSSAVGRWPGSWCRHCSSRLLTACMGTGSEAAGGAVLVLQAAALAPQARVRCFVPANRPCSPMHPSAISHTCGHSSGTRGRRSWPRCGRSPVTISCRRATSTGGHGSQGSCTISGSRAGWLAAQAGWRHHNQGQQGEARNPSA